MNNENKKYLKTEGKSLKDSKDLKKLIKVKKATKFINLPLFLYWLYYILK